MTKQRDVDALAGAIRHMIEVLIARDQGMIGTHERATEAQADLRDAIARCIKVEEPAS